MKRREDIKKQGALCNLLMERLTEDLSNNLFFTKDGLLELNAGITHHYMIEQDIVRLRRELSKLKRMTGSDYYG